MLDVLRKLKGRSIDELRVRGAQALSARGERFGLSRGARLPSDAALFRLFDPTAFDSRMQSSSGLLEHFRLRTSPKFYAAFDEPAKTRDELKQRFSRDSLTLIDRADRIVNGRFDLLGFKDLSFGEPIDWHFEPVSGKTSPLLHWSLIDEIDSIVSGDKKITWELNRHQYFETLGRAYWLTQDERYAQTFALHLDQWMDNNPAKIGLNWVSSLEIAFRAISWLWGLNFFRESLHLTPELLTRALKFLYLHARHLEMFLSTYSSPNTHLTGEALGLFYLGTMLPEFRDAARWKEKGRSILSEELERHVLPDGVYFERATYYHRYTTDFYTHFVILSHRNGNEIDEVVNARLQSLLDYLMYVTRPDGSTPFIGDDDGGQLAILDERDANDFRAALSAGAALFDREDYKYVAGEVAESTLWLLGSAGVRRFDELSCREPASSSHAFQDSRCYVMRDGWTSDANYLLFNCGPHGIFNGGHAHADSLSFELSAQGRKILVDPGTFTYTGSRELRDCFRSSTAHTCLTIDGESSSVPAGPFSWKTTASASTNAWKSDARFDFLQGTHDGYERLKNGAATHTRSMLFIKKDYWVMRDSVETKGSHTYEQRFQFAVGLHPEFKAGDQMGVSVIERRENIPGLQVCSFAEGGDWRFEDGWVSECYGKRVRASVYTFSVKGNGPQEFFSFLIPRKAEAMPASVREIDAVGGRAFELLDSTNLDFLVVGNGYPVETGRIKTDFRWAWVRLSLDSKTLEELVLINGHSFNYDGHDILQVQDDVDYVVGRRYGDKLLLEINETILEVTMTPEDLVTTLPIGERITGP